MAEWWIRNGHSSPFGPVSEEEVCYLISNRTLSSTSLCRQDNECTWHQLGQVTRFAELFKRNAISGPNIASADTNEAPFARLVAEALDQESETESKVGDHAVPAQAVQTDHFRQNNDGGRMQASSSTSEAAAKGAYRRGWRRDAVVAGVSAAAMSCIVGAVLFVLWLIPSDEEGARSGKASASTRTISTAEQEEEVSECDGAGGCKVLAKEGKVPLTGGCVRGWCFPTGPGCIRDVDCHVENRCTRAECHRGTCRLIDVHGQCRLHDGTSGTCRYGICDVASGTTCVVDEGCMAPKNSCFTALCTADQRCEHQSKADGDSCKTTAYAPGTCKSGRCLMDATRAAIREKRCKTKRYGYYSFQKCTRSLLYVIDNHQLAGARQKIHRLLAKRVRYDLNISLVALPDGGYNIILANRRSRSDVRGLVDPSFVAFAMASYTARSSWRSRNLIIWITPYKDGWTIPTHGSRKALRKGMRASRLGWLGVVDVRAYRKWLEKTFRPLKAPRRLESAL